MLLRDVTAERTADQAREAFLGVLSHELRTPITAIYGYAKVLQRPGRGAEATDMLADIEIEFDRLYRIVEDLLALNRVERGLEIEGEPLLLQHLIGPVLESESGRWPAVSFAADLQPGLPAVFGEQTYVEQVLRNFVSNAAKYGSVGSTVTVTVADTDTEVEVRVLDEGVGIDRRRPPVSSTCTAARPRPRTGSPEPASASSSVVASLLPWVAGSGPGHRPDGGSEFGFSLARCDETGSSEGKAATPGAVSVWDRRGPGRFWNALATSQGTAGGGCLMRCVMMRP